MVTHPQRKCSGMVFAGEGEPSADGVWGWRRGGGSRNTGVDSGSMHGSGDRFLGVNPATFPIL